MISEGIIQLNNNLLLTGNLTIEEFLSTDISKQVIYSHSQLGSSASHFIFPPMIIEGKIFCLTLFFYDQYLKMARLSNPDDPNDLAIHDWVERENIFKHECEGFLLARFSGEQPYYRNGVCIYSGEDVKMGYYSISFVYWDIQHYLKTGKRIPLHLSL